MRMVKTLIILALVGAIVGDIVATFLAPGLVTWYASPAGTSAALCDCAKLAHEISSQLIRIQGIGAVSGAVAFFVFGIVFKAGRTKKPATPAKSATATPPAGTGPTT